MAVSVELQWVSFFNKIGLSFKYKVSCYRLLNTAALHWFAKLQGMWFLGECMYVSWCPAYTTSGENPTEPST